MTQPLDRAKELRGEMTEAERFDWFQLRNRRFKQFKFRRQVPIAGYIVDFVCFDRRLIIELDGGQHTLQREYDAKRTECLEKNRFRVVRFWNHEVLGDWDAVAEVIWRELKTSP